MPFHAVAELPSHAIKPMHSEAAEWTCQPLRTPYASHPDWATSGFRTSGAHAAAHSAAQGWALLDCTVWAGVLRAVSATVTTCTPQRPNGPQFAACLSLLPAVPTRRKRGALVLGCWMWHCVELERRRVLLLDYAYRMHRRCLGVYLASCHLR